MELKAIYNNFKANTTNDLMLVLNFNDVDDNTLKKIVDKVCLFVERNLYCENSHYYLSNCNGIKILKRFQVPFEIVKDGPCSIGAMILPNKRLLKKVLEAPNILCDLNKLPKDECSFLEYFKNEEIRYCTCRKVDDFAIGFNRKNWEDSFSFECVISVNCFTLDYNYGMLVQLYKELIDQMSKEFNLFAAYIDFCGFAEVGLMYEYCYGVQNNVDTFNVLRTISWETYVSDSFLKMYPDFLTDTKLALEHEKMNNGLLFYAQCAIENYNREERKKVYNVLKKFLPKSYGVTPIECIMASSFRPCDDVAYMFEQLGNKYIVFSNGVDINVIKDELREEFFRYIKTIHLNNQGTVL